MCWSLPLRGVRWFCGTGQFLIHAEQAKFPYLEHSGKFSLQFSVKLNKYILK